MDTTRPLGDHCVAGREAAERWYTALLGRGPDGHCVVLTD